MTPFLDIVGESVEAVREVAAVVGGEEVRPESLCVGHRCLRRHHAVHHEAGYLGLGIRSGVGGITEGWDNYGS